MRKAAMAVILIASLSIGLPYMLNGRWWGLILTLLTGSFWCYSSLTYRARSNHHQSATLSSTLSFFVLAGFGIAGIFFGHHQVWMLTNFVLLLIAWDLDHYTRVLLTYEDQHSNKKIILELFYAHLKRLAILAGLGWGIGLAALNIRTPLNFSMALLLTFVMIASLRQVARYLVGRT